MDLPKRKPNRLKDYDYGVGAYFVTICTHERKCILSELNAGEGASGFHCCPSGICEPGLAPAAQIQLTQYGKIAEEQLLDLERRYPTVQIDKYVIMPNHIHMIVRILQTDVCEFRRGGVTPPVCAAPQGAGTGNPSPTLGNVIGWYKYNVTKRINLATGIPGTKIFQRSFHDHVIRNETDYREIRQYIEDNPAKWEMDRFYVR